MKNDLITALGNFRNALQSLNEGLIHAQEELQKDGVIQRFEFTFEL